MKNLKRWLLRSAIRWRRHISLCIVPKRKKDFLQAIDDQLPNAIIDRRSARYMDSMIMVHRLTYFIDTLNKSL